MKSFDLYKTFFSILMGIIAGAIPTIFIVLGFVVLSFGLSAYRFAVLFVICLAVMLLLMASRRRLYNSIKCLAAMICAFPWCRLLITHIDLLGKAVAIFNIDYDKLYAETNDERIVGLMAFLMLSAGVMLILSIVISAIASVIYEKRNQRNVERA